MKSPQAIPEVLPREVQVGPDRSIRNPQLLGDLPVFPALQVVKEEHLPPDFGQTFQAILQLFPDLESPEVLPRPPRARGKLRAQLFSPPQSFSPKEVPRAVSNDRKEPTAELLRIPAILQPLQSHQKRFLGYILCIFRVPRHRESDEVAWAHVPGHEDPEGLVSTLEGRPHQLPVGSLAQCTYSDTEGTLLVENMAKKRHPLYA